MKGEGHLALVGGSSLLHPSLDKWLQGIGFPSEPDIKQHQEVLVVSKYGTFF